MKDIPVHLLQDRTTLGLQLQYFKKGGPAADEAETLGAHRDDHYIFFVMEEGFASLMIDFHEIQLSGALLYYVLPTQVHHRIRNEMAVGWFIAVDTALIPPECRQVFERSLLLQQPCLLTGNMLGQYHHLLKLLLEKYEEAETTPFYIQIIHTLVRSFVVMAASCYNGSLGADLKISRTAQLSNQFKNLLVAEVRTVKSPAAFAARLNVSESYLNEALKKTTGFPVSYWIQQEVTMEAKRLLYYSQLTVKEIAHKLGYADHSYFSRLFRKVAGISALNFRRQYRK